jgi:hypothetical protein
VYRCAGTPRCHSVSAARLEATLLLHLDDLQTDPRFTDAIRSELQARIKAMEAKVGEGLAAARRQLKDVERQEARWRKLYMREKISEDTYLEEAPSLGRARVGPGAGQRGSGRVRTAGAQPSSPAEDIRTVGSLE